jgi:L-alanine-DL-glutamate epimerase-like enolase superfamily enzyme
LLGGKMRDRVRIYNGGVRFPMPAHTPRDYAENMAQMKEAKEGFTLIKQSIAFHYPGSILISQMSSSEERKPRSKNGAPLTHAHNPAMMGAIPDMWYDEPRAGSPHLDRGLMTERGFDYVVACVEAMKKVLGDEVGLALDCGPGWMVKDAIRFARALEPLHITWLEDLLTGDYSPSPNADLYRELTASTVTPIHTGEQIYLRENFMDLIERHAVNVIGPDPEDVGGIAELKWIAEYADLHGILVAPHGVFDGLFGLAAHVHLAAALPQNYIAFEYPLGQPDWWYDIVDGLPDPIVKKGFVDVWDKPGLGLTFNVKAAKAHLSDEDRGFFD